MRFIVDEQLPAGLAQALCDAGHEAAHVTSLGLGNARDIDIWRETVRLNAIVISKDQDFVPLVLQSPSKGRLLWIRSGNTSTKALIARLIPALPLIVSAFKAGERLVELE